MTLFLELRNLTQKKQSEHNAYAWQVFTYKDSAKGRMQILRQLGGHNPRRCLSEDEYHHFLRGTDSAICGCCTQSLWLWTILWATWMVNTWKDGYKYRLDSPQTFWIRMLEDGVWKWAFLGNTRWFFLWHTKSKNYCWQNCTTSIPADQ